MSHPKSPICRYCRIRGYYKNPPDSPCEDMVLLHETPDLFFYGLADGQSKHPCSAQGALESLNALCQFIREQGILQLLQHPFPDELPCLLMQQIRRSLLSLSGTEGGRFEDYASTLLAMAADPNTGEYLIIHLGDGCAIGLTKEDNLLMLSCPENGISANYTWLTTSDTAVQHMHVIQGQLQNLKRICLLSDGANCLCRGRNISMQGRKLIAEGSWQALCNYLVQSRPADDAACILLNTEP